MLATLVPVLHAPHVRVRKVVKPERVFLDVEEQFEREAVVTDSDWLRRLGVLADKLLPGIDVQVFPRDQLDAAKLWICEG